MGGGRNSCNESATQQDCALRFSFGRRLVRGTDAQRLANVRARWGSSRFSPLTDINAKNVATLKRAWTFHMAPPLATSATPPTGLAARLRQRRSEATPLVVDGVLYLPTPYNRVLALDAASGKQIWEYKVPNNANAGTRGVAYWPGHAGTAARIVFGTSDGFLIALDAATGKPAEQFGTEGAVDLKPGVANGLDKVRFSLSSPPAVYKDVVITGGVVQESPSTGPSGDTRLGRGNWKTPLAVPFGTASG